MALASRTNQKTSKEIARISETIRRTRFKSSDLIIPITVGVVLIALSLIVFVPMVSRALESQEEIKETKGKIEQLKNLERSLSYVDDNKLTDDVIMAKSVIPKVLKVSDFIYYVDGLAREKGLVMKELSAGDMNKPVQGDSGTGVSGPVSYAGSYQNIISFLEEVQTISPYIIRLENVIVGRNDEGVWHISLVLSGYYMADRSTNNLDIYVPFKAYTDYEDILEIFKEKAKNL